MKTFMKTVPGAAGLGRLSVDLQPPPGHPPSISRDQGAGGGPITGPVTLPSVADEVSPVPR